MEQLFLETTSNGNSFSATFIGGKVESVSGIDFSTTTGAATKGGNNSER